MSANKDLERRLTDHLHAEAPHRAPEWVLERTLASVGTTQQRRTLRSRIADLRAAGMPHFAPVLGAAAAIVVVVVAIGTYGSHPGIGGTPSPSPAPSASMATSPTPQSGGMWPQTSLEEVRAAQQLADAGDTRYTWQYVMNESQVAQNHPRGGEQFFARFLEEVLGWKSYLWHEAFAHPLVGMVDGDVVYVRCAEGRSNPLYPQDQTLQPDTPDCAPTIDDLQFETVKIHVAQLDRTGPLGIWVVTGWEMIKPARQADPRVVESEATDVLERFLAARVAGSGADQLGVGDDGQFADERADGAIPLLYATTSGARYERSQLAVVDGPQWPGGGMRFEVRLLADGDDTVVQQTYWAETDDLGALRVLYEFQSTTENGAPVPVAYRFLDGAVKYRAADPFTPSQEGWNDPTRAAVEGILPDDDAPRAVLVFAADPRPIGAACAEGPAAADAADLARAIQANPRLVSSEPTPVIVGGAPALQMDVAMVPGLGTCSWLESEQTWSSPLLRNVPFPHGTDRARLILVNLPEGSPARVLVLATVSDADSLPTVLAYAAPIVSSIEFRGR